MKIIIKVNKTTMICPARETPHHSLWLSNMDLIARNTHVYNIYFYLPNGSRDFFNPDTLKDALSQALVPFYPVAGRFKEDGENRPTEVDCNAKGVTFVEAETSSVIDDLGDFAPILEMTKLIPVVDYSAGISSFPLMVFQLTSFRCGGVSLVVGTHHNFLDGAAVLHFTNTWANMARSGSNQVTPAPFFDRNLLRARNLPEPKFDHIEYHPSPPLKKKTSKSNTSIAHHHSATTESEATVLAVLRITKDQINALRLKSKVGGYSTYEILAAHIWQSVCKARMLDHDQETKLYMMVSGRSRLQPPLPPGYFGNVIFQGAIICQAGDLISKHAGLVAGEIHDVLERIRDNVYLRSAIDYLEIQPDISALARGGHTYRCPNLSINNWTRIPIHTVDFGWGKPIFMGPASTHEGMSYILPSPLNDGSLSLVITLESQHVMKLFKKHLYGTYSSY